MTQKMGFFVLKTGDSNDRNMKLLPIVDVVATLITRGENILAVYNDRWGAFTLPTTKRRSWEDTNTAKGAAREEEWDDAAVRAAAEWLGATTTEKPEFAGDVPEFQQSDRDGKWKRYRLKAYMLQIDAKAEAKIRGTTEWLTAEQFVDTARRPISPTARHIVAELQHAGKL